jgi:hypothetical protein
MTKKYGSKLVVTNEMIRVVFGIHPDIEVAGVYQDEDKDLLNIKLRSNERIPASDGFIGQTYEIAEGRGYNQVDVDTDAFIDNLRRIVANYEAYQERNKDKHPNFNRSIFSNQDLLEKSTEVE